MKLNSQLYRGHGPKNINLILTLISFIRGVHNIAIQVKLEVITPGIIVINQAEHKIPLAVCQVLVGSARLQTVNQILVGSRCHLQLV
jgi:hypothetical protein